MTEYVHVGSHADVLASGRPVGPGERIADEHLEGEDRYLIDEGRLVPVEAFERGATNEPLSLEDARARAAELGIEGRSKMTADELRSAVVAHTNPDQEAPDAA